MREEERQEEEPRGAFVITLAYLGLVAALWVWVYAVLLARR
jgi:hypothetical protein